jgi:S-disulfanyl-L-cysteine oxidoreductase SoxD
MLFRAFLVAAAVIAPGLAVAPALGQDDLPKVGFTAAQVSGGKAEYEKSCLDCHGANLDDGEFGGPPLRGSSFESKFFGITADSLFGFMQAAMPPDRPGRLSPETYAELTAYILSKNGIQPGGTALPSDIEALSGLMVSK